MSQNLVICYYNGIKVTRDEYIRLKALEKRCFHGQLAIHKGLIMVILDIHLKQVRMKLNG